MAWRSGILRTLAQAHREAEKRRLAQQRLQAQLQTQAAKAAAQAQKAYEQAQLADQEARAIFEQQVAEAQQRVAAQHAEIDHFQQDLSVGVPSAVVDYFTMVLSSSNYPDGFPQHAKLAYVAESKQLVIEYDLPSFEVVPEVGSYKYLTLPRRNDGGFLVHRGGLPIRLATER